MHQVTVNSGVKTKLIGMVLVFLGILDNMLSWRGGVEVSGWHVILIVSGLFLFAVGAIRSNRRSNRTR